MAAKAVKLDTNIYTVQVSGKVYEAGVRDRFPVKPSKTRKRGFGYQVSFEVSRTQMNDLVDIMADMATPEDESAFDAALSDQVAVDLGRFPKEAGL